MRWAWNLLLGLLFVESLVENERGIVFSGRHVRFTVLTKQMVRMEYDFEGVFRDARTFLVQNRTLNSIPSFSVQKDEEWTVIRTDKLEIRHKFTSIDSFSSENLLVKMQDVIWNPSIQNSKRLHGTIRTLDTENSNGPVNLDCLQAGPKYIYDTHCALGLISREGYVVLDDSIAAEMDQTDGWPWLKKSKVASKPQECTVSDQRICGENIMTRSKCEAVGCCYTPYGLDKQRGFNCYYSPRSKQDLYFLGHGLEFKQALYDFTQIAGKIPIPPRYAMGVFYSRYWAYDDVELREQVIQRYDDHSVPLDVIVIDMDWHLTFYDAREKDQAGQFKGWTGYTWNKHLFPDPEAFISWCHSKGLHVTLNLHPASGIQPWEESYSEMKRRMGMKPVGERYVPFRIADKKFAENWLNVSLGQREDEGVDFWWIDWQQGEDWIENKEKISHVNPTYWLNYVFFTNPNMWKKRNLRPMILHRWGGLGNHRYQIGFSGDVRVSWESLAFQPYFTSMAANVGFGYWSHDVGGFWSPTPPELYTRWIQWGVFSPIFRTHCMKNLKNVRRIWMYPEEYYEIMRDMINLRASLIPYIYTEAYKAHQTGLSIVHGLYFDWPEHDEAYSFKEQYLFGSSLLVSPIVAPVSAVRKLAIKHLWIPPGTWIDITHGQMYLGPAHVTKWYTLDEVPVFGRAGRIIPMAVAEGASSLGRAQHLPRFMKLLVLPGKEKAEGELYEDDGKTDAYQRGAFAITHFNATFLDSTAIDMSILPPNGIFDEMLHSRRYKIVFFATAPAKWVTVDDVELFFCKNSMERDCWSYDGQRLSLEIHLVHERNVSVPISIHVNLINLGAVSLVNGMIGQLSRMRLVKSLISTGREYRYPIVLQLAQIGAATTYDPSLLVTALYQLNSLWNSAIAEVKHELTGDDRERALGLLNENMTEPKPKSTSSEKVETSSVLPIAPCVMALSVIGILIYLLFGKETRNQYGRVPHGD